MSSNLPFVVTPKILLPKKDIDLSKWSCIACDQFTSEPVYWLQLKQYVGESASAYKLILPEVFLNDDSDKLIKEIHKNMQDYLHIRLFDEIESMVLVERKTPYNEKRIGLMVAIDLESYDFLSNDASIIASEETVKERIPARVNIRQGGDLELPHTIVLIDDKESNLMERIYMHREEMEVLYDFDLNMNGGHLKGYKVPEDERILHKLMGLHEGVKMVVGDGNHSLAAAKVCWELIKKNIPDKEFYNHPARYSLVEVISLYDKGLTFEPIHRILFPVKNDIFHLMKKHLKGDGVLKVFDEKKEYEFSVSSNPFEAIKQIQVFLDGYMKEHRGVSIDYVHGLDSLKTVVANHPKSLGIIMPELKREEFFPYVKENGSLPRKSFSLGEAIEKRYYMEARRITK